MPTSVIPEWEPEIDRICRDCSESPRRSVLVQGPVGSGKTSLLSGVAVRLAPTHFVARVRGRASTRDASYLSLEHLVDAGLSEQSPPAVAFGHLRQGLLRRAAGRPVAITVDNSEFVDPLSLALISLLTSSEPVAVVAASDDADTVPEFAQLVAAGVMRRFRMAPLGFATVSRIVSDHLGGAVTAGTVEYLHELSGGNPLMLHVALQVGLEEGWIAAHSGVWAATPSGTWAADAALSDLLVRLLARVDGPERHALEVLAVLGALPLDGALALVTASALPALERLGLVGFDEGPTVRIVGPGVEAAVRSSLEPGRVRDIWAATTRALPEMMAEPHLGGVHVLPALRAGVPVPAEGILAAAERTSREPAPAASEELLAHVPADESRARLVHARNLYGLGRFGAALKQVRPARAGLRDRGDVERAVQGWRLETGLLLDTTGDVRAAGRLVAELRAWLAEVGRPDLLPTADALDAVCRWFAGDHAAAIGAYRDGAGSGDEESGTVVALVAAEALAVTGQQEEALGIVRRLDAAGRPAATGPDADPYTEDVVAVTPWRVLLLCGLWDRCLAAMRAQRRRHAGRLSRAGASTEYAEAMLLAVVGRPAEAEDLFLATVAPGAGQGPDDDVRHGVATLLAAARSRPGRPRPPDLVAASRGRVPPVRRSRYAAYAAGLCAALGAGLQRGSDAALGGILDVAADARGRGEAGYEAIALLLGAQILQDPQRGTIRPVDPHPLATLERGSARGPGGVARGATSTRLLGELAGASARNDGLIGAQCAALARGIRESDPRALLRAADLAARGGNPALRDVCAQAGLRLARRDGRDDLTRELRDRMRHPDAGPAGGSGAPTGEAPGTAARDGLSARERDVVRRAAAGEANGDIARALGISVRTVETHLHHAYRKLGVSGRRELAAAGVGPADRAG